MKLFLLKLVYPLACSVILFIDLNYCFAQSQYHFQHFGTQEGLANEFAYTMAQDGQGFVWIQYYGGLSRFDGYDFKVYKHDPADSTRSALDFLLGPLIVDPMGNIWIREHKPLEIPNYPVTLVKYEKETDGFIKHRFDLRGASLSEITFDTQDPTV